MSHSPRFTPASLLLCTAGAIVCVAVLTGGAIIGWASYLQIGGNFHTIEPALAYRSNTLTPRQLENVVQHDGIRTIINLRGAAPGEAWYDDEQRFAQGHHLAMIDIPMRDDEAPSAQTVDVLVAALRTAQRPILIHCKAGSDRTGLASALFEYDIMHRTPAEAATQLSFAFGHFPWLGSRTVAMDRAFWTIVG